MHPSAGVMDASAPLPAGIPSPQPHPFPHAVVVVVVAKTNVCPQVNPFGLHFSRMTASNLLLVDHHGKVVGGGKPGRGQIYNAAAFVIHSAIHAARPEVNSVVHAHSIYAKAFSTLGRKLPMYTQDACIFYNDHALYAKHGGVVLSSGESEAICKSIGGNKAVILQNHGLLTVGGCIESAVGWFQM